MNRNNRSRALLVPLFVLVLLAALPGPHARADSSAEARDWFDRMTRAAQTLNYDATFVYVQGKQLEAMRIIHRADGGGERERLISLSGSPREIVRDGAGVACVQPKRSTLLVGKRSTRAPFPGTAEVDTRDLARHYDFLTIGRDRMTGHDARVIAIRPKDQYRYGYRLWLDEATAMLLKSELIGHDGAVLEQVMFTSLTLLDEIPASVPESGVEGNKETLEGPGATEAGDSNWEVTRLPAGFAPVVHEKQRMQGSSGLVEHMVFTDGLGSVSVFIERADGGKSLLSGSTHMGAVNAYGGLVAGHQVTVVGEVPQATVSTIGQSVRYVPEKNSQQGAR